MTIHALTSLLLAALLCGALAQSGTADDPLRVTIAPTEIDDVLYNPGMGFTTSNSFDGDVAGYPRSRIAYWGWYWDEIEPKEGAYRWDLLDDAIETARARGQRLAIRIMPANGRGGAPQWYKDLGANGYAYTSEAGPTNWMPDHSDPLYLKHMGGLVRSFGERYDGHPDIDHIDMRSLGHWGEWHFYFVDQEHEVEVAPEVRRALVDIYLESFEKTPLVMLIGGGEELAYAISRGAGWRADCLGDLSSGWNHMNDFYQQALDAANANEAWKRAPVVLESCWTMQHWADNGWDVEFIFSEALRWHCSAFNNKSSAIPSQHWGAVESFMKKMGYRLALRRATHPTRTRAGGTLRVESEWENVGVAPPYRNYIIAFRLTPIAGWDPARVIEDPDYDIDVRTWLPGKHAVSVDLAVPQDTKPGRNRLSVALLDPFTREPAVQLAIAGRDAQGWYSLSQVEVAAADEATAD